MNSEFQVRRATPDDIEVISWHRARMFQDMDLIPDHLFESFRARSLEYLRVTLASGEYAGWLIFETNHPQEILAGAGVLLRRVPPFPTKTAKLSSPMVARDSSSMFSPNRSGVAAVWRDS